MKRIIIDFDKVYESNNYGPFKIIEDLGGHHKRVRIKFLNTGFTNEVCHYAAIRGEVKDHSLQYTASNSIQIDFDKIYESKNYGPFKIIENLGGSHKRVRIKFLNTGYTDEVCYYAAIAGKIKDNSLPYATKNTIQIDFDKIYESKNYGPFKIIEDLGGNPKRVRIKFLNTGFTNEVRYNHVIDGNVRDNSVVRKNTIQIDTNKIYQSNNYGPFKIIEDLGGSPKRVRIKFLNTGFTNEVYHYAAIRGEVKDHSLPYKLSSPIQIDFNKIYQSNNYGPFKIIEDLGGSPRRVRIKFFNTEYIDEVKCYNAIRGNVRDYSLQYNASNSTQIDFDKVYESRNYGPFKIIEDLGEHPKRVRIKFLNTGFTNEVRYYNTIKGEVRDYSLQYNKSNSIKIDTNKIYQSNNYGPFKIIEDLGGNPKRARIKFLNTGYTDEVRYQYVIEGEVRDHSIKNS